VPPEVSIVEVLRKHLGKDMADAMAAKIDQMISDKKSPAEIETAFRRDLSAHIKTTTDDVMNHVRPPTFPPPGHGEPPHGGHK
jgi:hypothetical protein